MVRTNTSIAGAARFLDKKIPNWYEKINIDRLDQLSGSVCILGQLFGDYCVGLLELGIPAGTHAFGTNFDKGMTHIEKTKEWKKEVGKRMNNSKGSLNGYAVTATRASDCVTISIKISGADIDDVLEDIGFKPDSTNLEKMCERYPSLADEFKAVHEAGVKILDTSNLRCAFTWKDTPQGHEFWNGAFKALEGDW